MSQVLEHDVNDAILARLDALSAKLDYVVERQRYVEELVDEMTPVVREIMGVAAGRLGELEAKGYFAVGAELMAMVDKVVTTYGPEEVHRLGDHIVAILDTVRNVTQPDVLAVANETTNVLHHADEVKPVGLFGVARASSDDDVQRGLGVALEILRHLGRASKTGERAPVDPVPTRPMASRPAAPAARVETPTASKPAPRPVPVIKDATPAPEVVEWEGVRFTRDGFLLDPNDWSPELAAKMAAALGITLTDEHMAVLEWIRADVEKTGASPNVRRIATGTGLGTKRIYELFPKTPGKTAARLAGVGKPVGCV